MKRLYYLSNDLECTQQAAQELNNSGISDWHFCVYSQHTEGLRRYKIHRAGPLKRLDIVHSAERGALFGLAFGILVGGLLHLADTPGFPVNGQFFALICSLCCLLGIGLGAGVGFSQRNYKIAPFQPYIDQGEQLIMIDVRRNQQLQVEALMRRDPFRKVGEGSTISNPFRDYEPKHESEPQNADEPKQDTADSTP